MKKHFFFTASLLLALFTIGYHQFGIQLFQNSLTQDDIQGMTVNAQTSCDSYPHNWSQIGNNTQHTGDSPESLGSNFPTRTWTRAFQPERIYPQVQAIVYCGNVYVGTEDGNLYALNATNGTNVWAQPFHTEGPITASVAAADNTIYVADMHSNVYAVDALNGTQKWKSNVPLSWRYGFFTAPVVAENKVFIGRNDGTFYALNTSDGIVAWETDIGSSILQTAAYNKADDNVGRIFFGAMNMHNYALDASNGTILWDTGKIAGWAFKDYWPVVYDGKVFNRPMGLPALLVMDEKTGTNITPVYQDSGQTMNGASSPPCVDKDIDGNDYLIVPSDSHWAKLSLTDLLNLSEHMPFPMATNPDENVNPTCTANYILSMHTQEANANFTGAYNLTTKTWTQISPGRTNNQMFTNTQGGGGNPASISNGWIYHISYHEVIARNTN